MQDSASKPAETRRRSGGGGLRVHCHQRCVFYVSVVRSEAYMAEKGGGGEARRERERYCDVGGMRWC